MLSTQPKAEADKGPFIFYERGGASGIGRGALEKNWLERGDQPKRNEGQWGVGRKN